MAESDTLYSDARNNGGYWVHMGGPPTANILRGGLPDGSYLTRGNGGHTLWWFQVST